MHLFLHRVHSQHVPLRTGLQHRDLALGVHQIQLAVGRYRGGEVLAQSLRAAPLLQDLARCGIEGGNNSAVFHQVQDTLINQWRRNKGKVLLEPPCHGVNWDLATGRSRPQRDGSEISGRNQLPRLVPLRSRQLVILVRVEPAEVPSQIGIVVELRFGQFPVLSLSYFPSTLSNTGIQGSGVLKVDSSNRSPSATAVPNPPIEDCRRNQRGSPVSR